MDAEFHKNKGVLQPIEGLLLDIFSTAEQFNDESKC